MKAYMAISIHLNSQQKFEIKCFDLAEIGAPHTAANIFKCFKGILEKYGLDVSDIFKVVCDNAANLKKAFRLNLWDFDDDNAEGQEDPEDEEELDDDLDAVGDVDTAEVAAVFTGEFRLPCFIHTLQLFVYDCIKALGARYKSVLSKAKVACKKQHQSIATMEAIKTIMPSLGKTRWNGQLALLRVVIKEFTNL